MDNDRQISQKANLKPIIAIGRALGLRPKDLELYGNYKAKVSFEAIKKAPRRRGSRYIVVAGITPTHLGEGKTVTTIGLSMALNRIGRRAVCCIRQPSLGPFFGIKGGGVGGGRSQVLPEEINMHLTGDIHAVGQAHNLCASFLDNHLYRGNALGIDPGRIFWHRVIDVNDRPLRNVQIGLGGGSNGVERHTRFDITASSEIMAILALAASVPDLRARVGRIVVGLTSRGKGVTSEDLKVAGAMAAILKDALKPNLVQTIENTPCFVHTGPFANITHGNSSIIADKAALAFSDFVVTESGFGADCGLEKFINIKCRTSGLRPDAVVLVASVRALKVHSGMYKASPGKPLDRHLQREHVEALEVGSANLVKQIENSRIYGMPCIVAINRFVTDTPREIERLRRIALEHGAFDCVVNECYRYGSAGGADLARSVIAASAAKPRFNYLYPDSMPIKEKIRTIACKIYGAKDVHFDKAAEDNIAVYNRLGYAALPICMAKTHLSLSHDPSLKGAPAGFTLPVRDVRPSVGAGFLYALCGKVQTMPSLPSHPAGESIDIDSMGRLRYVHR
jgi:formate--tetrahydrofolate ligase